jgi:hypothetical protein
VSLAAPLNFADLLGKATISPVNVRMLRHQARGPAGRTPFTLWRDGAGHFDEYQAVQDTANRAKLNAPVWASFVVTPAAATLFVGLYGAIRVGTTPPGRIDPLSGKTEAALGSIDPDLYALSPLEPLSGYIGRLTVDWGPGMRSWIQRADRQPKPIVEILRAYREPDYPGHARFLRQLSDLEAMPPAWAAVLRASRGVYLLTCPRTREQYVGSASGEGGFLARWLGYLATGHGGNVALKSRDPSDYQVSILEVCASSASVDDILATEQLWKAKLQSREMGLNRN